MHLLRAIVFLSATFLAGCGEPPTNITIPFVAQIGGDALACGDNDAIVSLTDLRFYVSDVVLRAADGGDVDLTLDNDARWQHDGLALLDLEDGTGLCLNGTAALHTSLQGEIAAGNYRGLRFTVGVPFGRNHADPLQAKAPLGDAAMHWHWRGGYKFLRAGIRTADDGFWIHLGSTGCEGTIKNITGCHSPNRVTVELDGFVPGRDTVVIDFAALSHGVDLGDALATNCSSGAAETACAEPFNSLGLVHSTGNASPSQRVFRLQERY